MSLSNPLVKVTIKENNTERLEYELINYNNYENLKVKLNNSSNRLLIKNFSYKKYIFYDFYISKWQSFIKRKGETFISLNNSEEKIKINTPLTLDFSKLDYDTLTLDIDYINNEYCPFKIDLNSFKNKNSTINFLMYFKSPLYKELKTIKNPFIESPLFKNLELFKNLHIKSYLKNISFITDSKNNLLNSIKYELYEKEKIYKPEYLLDLYSIIILQKVGIKFSVKEYYISASLNSYINYEELKTIIERKMKINKFISLCEDYLKLQKHSIEF